MTSDGPTHSKLSGSVPGSRGADHSTDLETALSQAEARCKAAGVSLTPVRRKVLEILMKERHALGAYAILEHLREAGFGSQPPVAYRALDFLMTHGFVHKIERLSAFVACNHPDHQHSPAFMICRICDSVEEAQSAPNKNVLDDAARAAGFQIERTVIEAEGVCPKCSDKARA